MKFHLLFLPCLFLCACSHPAPSESFSFSSEEISSLSSPESTPQIEQNDTLRYWWLLLSANNGKLVVEGETKYWFLGSSFYEEGTQTGQITLKNQGTFEFRWDNHDIEFGDCVGLENVKTTFSISRLASSAVNSFVLRGSKAILSNPKSRFPSIWFSMIGEPRNPVALEYFEISKTGNQFLVDYGFSEEDGNKPPIHASIASVGNVHEEVIENTLNFPPTLPPREAFDEEILRFIEEKTGDSGSVPFPQGVTSAFSDKLQNKQISIASFGTNILSSYQELLVHRGFSLDKNGYYSKTFRVGDRTNQALLFFNTREDREVMEIAITMAPQESESLYLVNKPLSELFFPEFPSSVFLARVYLLDYGEDYLDCVIVFTNEATAREYVADIYTPWLHERNYSLVDPGDGAFYRVYQYLNQTISVIPGGRGNEYGYPLGFHFSRVIIG